MLIAPETSGTETSLGIVSALTSRAEGNNGGQNPAAGGTLKKGSAAKKQRKPKLNSGGSSRLQLGILGGVLRQDTEEQPMETPKKLESVDSNYIAPSGSTFYAGQSSLRPVNPGARPHDNGQASQQKHNTI